MLKAIRSPWFAFGFAVLFALLAILVETYRITFFGLAESAAFYGVLDYIFAPKED